MGKPMLTLGQSLMLAVLEQALADLRSVSGKVSRQARAWFLARNNRSEHVFSFARICREFGYDPVAIRSHVFAELNGTSQTMNEGNSETANERGKRPRGCVV